MYMYVSLQHNNYLITHVQTVHVLYVMHLPRQTSYIHTVLTQHLQFHSTDKDNLKEHTCTCTCTCLHILY